MGAAEELDGALIPGEGRCAPERLTLPLEGLVSKVNGLVNQVLKAT